MRDIAVKEVEAALSAIPQPLRERACEPAVILLRKPSDSLDCADVEEDTMGLFIGNAFSDAPGPDGTVGPRIYLFLRNIWDEADHEPERFRAELRDTLLHELGHYLGLEEDDLVARGIE